MNDMLSRIKDKFNLLQKRERKLLLLGFGLISISIVYLSVKPLFVIKEDLNEDLKASKEDFLWMACCSATDIHMVFQLAKVK